MDDSNVVLLACVKNVREKIVGAAKADPTAFSKVVLHHRSRQKTDCLVVLRAKCLDGVQVVGRKIDYKRCSLLLHCGRSTDPAAR